MPQAFPLVLKNLLIKEVFCATQQENVMWFGTIFEEIMTVKSFEAANQGKKWAEKREHQKIGVMEAQKEQRSPLSLKYEIRVSNRL